MFEVRRVKRITVSCLGIGLAVAFGGAACGSAGGEASSKTDSVAVLVGGGSNAYQAAGVEAIKASAADAGISVDVFDAAYEASKQYSQLQTALTSGKYGGVIIDPVDGAGIVSLVKQAKSAGIEVASWNQPIGSDYTTPEPTVDGVTNQAMLPLTESGRISGELTKKACADAKSDPCKVAILYYKKGSTYDTAVMEGFDAAIADSPSIQVVAGADTEATRQGGLAGAQTILTGTPDTDVMVGTSQAVTGAVPAVANSAEKVFLIGQALTRQGAEGVRSGDLYGGTQAMAGEEGRLAFEQLVNAMEGKPFISGINPGEYLNSPCLSGVLQSNVEQCSFDFNG
ncbi:sugar ABC transporter substrate-binding protein [Rhodococcus sp. JS3073]|uniref:sugar ABC transporter substrate-binding protein n=1 Tax=Rhodococcus sp. JS3073 TaxID=3002901 RepID=UPI002285F0FB|nr:sugar ABC transporter substrate-binding protein [Rhodococcus sp. JS3073]WAM12080.1 sugar ABC transporter substrate-binding protein [Rhodococcus sp. JS3073]